MAWVEAFSKLAKEPGVHEIMKTTAPAWYQEISHSGSGLVPKMKRELLDFCMQVSVGQPLVVVIDDLQWADDGSVDLLAFVADRLEWMRTLVVVCYRSADMKIKNH